eukprot:TRINITY_DN3679_c0_g1_i1.p2 TRINITY_DN3679_c0_g1~~TRINITY_DN3679_c0_g1_i1.p2  ORF type:complete len:633 (-),score=148.59 TRINITY_DN3679_c0_g1_i1:130-2028(-)
MKVALLMMMLLFAGVLAEFEHPPGRRVLYIRDGPPSKVDNTWEHVRESIPNEMVEFSIALPQGNVDGLRERLDVISNPKSPDYGQWLTKEQVFEYVATDPELASTVEEWLMENGRGLIDILFTGDSYRVKATIDYVERLFRTQMHVFQSPHNGRVVHKHLGQLSVPEDLASSIILVTGITEFEPRRLQSRTKTMNDGEANSINTGGHVVEPAHPLAPGEICNTPMSMRELYNLTDTDYVMNKAVSQAPFAQVTGGADGFGEKSLALFQQVCALKQNPIARAMGTGSYAPVYSDGEANLDVCMITSIGINATTDFFIVANGWIYEYTQQFYNTTAPPLVNSISYAWNEDQECANSSLPFLGRCKILDIPNSRAYVNRTNIEFMKLVSQGYTFVSASGDGGTNGGHGGDSCSRTHALFPASSPYVVAVGATVTIAGERVLGGNWSQPICSGKGKASCTCNDQGEETTCMSGNYGGFDSGGGFSQFDKTPSYQAASVSQYLNSSATRPTAEGAFNANGRGYPDVAAIGGNVAVVIDGDLQLQGGTSASTPMIAGMISILNSMRLEARQPLLGFVHPLLYQAAEECTDCYHDITTGYNGQGCRDMGFEATIGWDPCTGLGSINFAVMKEYVMSHSA